MAVIIMGSGAIDGDGTTGIDYTYIDTMGTADGDGTITSVEIWAFSDLTDVKIGTFTRDGSKFTSRDYAIIGNVTSGSKQTFTEDSGSNPIAIEVQTGDYLGIYVNTGRLERSTSGSTADGVFWLNADQFDAGEQTYTNTFWENDMISIYATGETAPVGTNMQINIGGVLKDVDSMKINIGGVLKDVDSMKINIGGVWKDVFG